MKNEIQSLAIKRGFYKVQKLRSVSLPPNRRSWAIWGKPEGGDLRLLKKFKMWINAFTGTSGKTAAPVEKTLGNPIESIDISVGIIYINVHYVDTSTIPAIFPGTSNCCS